MSTWINIAEAVYPIGSIYMSFSNVSPANLFGGSWEQITDRFLLSSSGAGNTGGEATHVLTEPEMPKHQHDVAYQERDNTGDVTAWGASMVQGVCNYNWHGYTDHRGNSQPHNNMPPYITIFCWRRIS